MKQKAMERWENEGGEIPTEQHKQMIRERRLHSVARVPALSTSKPSMKKPKS
jgi:hypothetical protein